MRVWKLVSGILSIVLSVFVIFQSFAAGTYNALSANGEISGSAGFFVAILMLAGGIVSICVRNLEGIVGDIVLIILFGIAALLGFCFAGSYADLNIWAFWCLIIAALALISSIRKAFSH